MSYMLVSDWQNIKHFKPTDPGWGDWRKIRSSVIYMLDSLREKLKTPIIVTSGSMGKHTANSYHYQGLALDIIFPGKLLSDLPDIAQKAEDMGWSGIGVYNNWSYHEVLTPGMHLDLRSGKAARWVGTDSGYLPFTGKNLKRYFIDFIPS